MSHTDPRLKLSTVAFADVMGTGSRSLDEERSEGFLSLLLAALEKGRALARGDQLAHGLSAQWFSDNMCLSVPGHGPESLAVVLRATAAIAAAFAATGVFLRGAVTVDLFFSSNDNNDDGPTACYGPALTRAAEAEKHTARYPRIVLLPPAHELAVANAAHLGAPLILDKRDGRIVLDFARMMENQLGDFAQHIITSVDEARAAGDQDLVAKLDWLSDYYEFSTSRSPRRTDRTLVRRSNKFQRIATLP